MRLSAIDLFAGCGGLSRGFIDAGYNILVGVDNDAAALKTFKINHDGSAILNADLSQPEAFDSINKIINGQTIDVIIAGPPCQGFSLTGPRNFDDKRNKLYLAVIEAVKRYKPKVFIIENVPGMSALYNGEIKNEVIRRLTKLGYNVKADVLCAADYGVPQMRKRLIFMGVRTDVGDPCFPEPVLTPDKYVTCSQALSDLPSREPTGNDLEWFGKEIDIYTSEPLTDYQRRMRGKCTKLYNHVATQHKQFVIDTIAQVPEGCNYKSLPTGVGESRRFNEAWTRYHSAKPSRTIDTGHRNHFHYKYNRVPTIRENARLQSFSDDFIFLGTKTQQNRQVGNAVPPLLGYHLGLKLRSIIERAEVKPMINTIDLFSGCGGLTEGFKQNGNYNTIACVEWDKLPYNTLLNRFKTKWSYTDAENRILRFDIQRVDEMINGWDDKEYGRSYGLDSLVAKNGGNVDLIIGGPPCQAYSIALRNRNEKNLSKDYRNFLFESYVKLVSHYKPKAFVFENVPGILTAAPGNGKKKIIDIIRRQFLKAGYVLLDDLKEAVIDFTEYGVPQNRKRIIILGLNTEHFGSKAKERLQSFYRELLPKYKTEKQSTVRDAIGDLPKLFPLDEPIIINKKRYAHTFSNESGISNHTARYNCEREIKTFRLLAEDIASGRNEYTSIKKLTELYNSLTGRKSNVHKYYVLRWDEPSNTIPAHLYKDGLRHIHPDPEQARTITVREAARLQTFPDDFEFISGTAMDYKIIGNAVPPLFAEKLANALTELIK